MITHSELKQLLHYSVITGEFYWIKPRQNIKVGDIAGFYDKDGYIRIKISGKCYPAHRLAWFWVIGEWPVNEIDHKNGVPNANYWLNIREATRSQNGCNRGISSNNKSGYKGIYWNKAEKKWHAQITLNNKKKHLGFFADIEEACDERLKAEKEMHGKFTRSIQ